MTDKTKIFIEKAILKHNNIYDYSLVNYLGVKSKIKIICPIHGLFKQTPTNHLQGRGCQICGGSNNLTLKTLIYKSEIIHANKYDYSLVKYVNNNTKIKIICSEHGKFEQTPNDHLCGKGCSKCGVEKRIIKRLDTINNFILKANYIHNNLYNYSKSVYINSYTKIKINCSIHGEFEQLPTNHLQGKGCHYCKESKGEKEIRKYLIDNKINFISQYKFKDCKYKKPLPFDFYLPDYKICIEFNGIQHYKPIKFFGGQEKMKETQLRDKIKMEYCNENNIPLLIIKYNENIKEKLYERIISNIC